MLYKHLKSMSGSDQVNQMSFRGKSESKNACYRCGRSGHFGRDPSCPAKSATCNKCDNIGHFASMCRTKGAKQNAKAEDEKPKPRTKPEKGGKKGGKGYWKNSQNFVQQEFDGYDSDDSDYAFSINERKSEQCELVVNVGGVEILTIPDSGSTASTVTEDDWKYLKRNKISCKSSTDPGPCLYPYQSKKP